MFISSWVHISKVLGFTYLVETIDQKEAFFPFMLENAYSFLYLLGIKTTSITATFPMCVFGYVEIVEQSLALMLGLRKGMGVIVPSYFINST